MGNPNNKALLLALYKIDISDNSERQRKDNSVIIFKHRPVNTCNEQLHCSTFTMLLNKKKIQPLLERDLKFCAECKAAIAMCQMQNSVFHSKNPWR